MIEALILFAVMCLSTWVVYTMEEPTDFWDDPE